MGKHLDMAAASPSAAVPVSQEEQKELLEKLGPMTTKALRGLYAALVATKLCYMCLGRPGEIKAPLKMDEDGKCINCVGAGRVQDFDKFKWAFEEIMGRKLPMPKAIEMRVEDKSDKAALASFFMNMSKQQVLDMERVWTDQVNKIARLAAPVIDAEVAHGGNPPD